METTTFKCEVITPMFMAGADGKTPELRPSEFKGMMRFWWRAVKAEDDIKKLRKEEAEIFGGTGEGEGKSKVAIRIIHPLTEKIGDNIESEIRNLGGLRYLFYSTFSLRARGEPIIRKYIKDGYDFNIILSSLHDENSYKHALASLWLAIHLGGFGTRARRGGGNITVKETEGDTYGIDFIPKGNNSSEIKKWLDDNLKKIKDVITPFDTKKYSNLKDSQIMVFKQKISWKEALNFLGEEFKNFRIKNKTDIWNMAAFGMPIMHNRFTIRMLPYNESNKRLSERMGSPIIIKVIKSGTLYFPIIVKLNCDIGFVGKEEKIGNKWREANKSNIRSVNFSKIDEFINSIKKEAEEIKL